MNVRQLLPLRFQLAILSVGFAVLLTSCSREQAAPKQQEGGGGVPVLVAQATSEDVPVEIAAVGNVRAFSTVSVRPQVTGPITEVHFDEGQEVKAGDLMFTIDRRPFEAALNQSEANLKRDEAQMTNARLEFLRQSNLFESKIASQADFDTAEANYRAAQSVVMADQAAITNAQVNLSYTEIRSPIEGRTGNLAVKAGNVVKAPDDVLVTITQIRPIYVAFAVPERHLPEIRDRVRAAALPVQVFVTDNTNQLTKGELTFIDNTVDTNTGTILLKATFANTNEVLWPGQFVQAALTLNTLKNVTVVPSHAVQVGQNGEYAFVVSSNLTAEVRTNLATGITYQGQTVVTRGVQPGETVVTDGQLKLTPGAKVAIKSPPAEGSSANEPVEQP